MREPILVTGVAGFIGFHLARRLLADGWTVYGLDNLNGYYDWSAFHVVQGALNAALAAEGAHLNGVLACAYHADGRAPLRVDNHPWRKPNPGMIVEAARRMQLDLPHSWIVGDRAHDLAAGAAARLAGGTLLDGDPQERPAAAKLAAARFIVEMASDLAGAVAALFDRGQFEDRGRS